MEDGTVTSLNNEVTAVKLGPPLKSSLKKPPSRCFSAQDNVKAKSERSKENLVDSSVCFEKRSITWVDTHGEQLTQVKEFEPSDSEDSDTEQEYGLASCACAIQ